MACELCDRWSPTACDKCGTVVPAAFIAIETQDGAPIDEPKGFMWCVVCHGKRVDAALRDRAERAEAALDDISAENAAHAEALEAMTRAYDGARALLNTVSPSTVDGAMKHMETQQRADRAEAALVIEAKSALLCNDALAEERAAIADLEVERDHYRTVFANACDQRESAREKLAAANKRWEQLREPLRQWAVMNDHERREKKVPMLINPHTVLAWMAALETKDGA